MVYKTNSRYYFKELLNVAKDQNQGQLNTEESHKTGNDGRFRYTQGPLLAIKAHALLRLKQQSSMTR